MLSMYSLSNCDKVVDEVAYRLTRDAWYGYKFFYNHAACVESKDKRINIHFHPTFGYEVDVVSLYDTYFERMSWFEYTGNIGKDADYLYNLVISML